MIARDETQINAACICAASLFTHAEAAQRDSVLLKQMSRMEPILHVCRLRNFAVPFNSLRRPVHYNYADAELRERDFHSIRFLLFL